ncbi:MAG: hypothetical protein JSS82_10020 [Bacteroidetes bacterium]|nr:hypothetical protein [Bacteroidota bacterium]
MKKLISYLIVPAILFAACKGGGNSTNSDGSINLKFNFQKGSKYKYAVKNSQTIKESAMGQSMEIHQDMDMTSSYEVSAADGDNKKLTVTYDRIAMKQKNAMAGMDMNYDSDDKEHSNPMLNALGDMLHKPFSMTVTDKGEVMAVDGFDKLMPAGGKTIVSDSTIRDMMQQAFYIYPQKAVKPGDTWSNSYAMSMQVMKMKTDNNFKLVSVSNGVAHVEMSSTISTAPGAGGAETKDLKMELNGTQTGSMDIDVNTGMLINSKLKQQIAGNIETQGMKMPMSINTEVNVTGSKVN